LYDQRHDTTRDQHHHARPVIMSEGSYLLCARLRLVKFRLPWLTVVVGGGLVSETGGLR
jgi:hypothetical protein